MATNCTDLVDTRRRVSTYLRAEKYSAITIGMATVFGSRSVTRLAIA